MGLFIFAERMKSGIPETFLDFQKVGKIEGKEYKGLGHVKFQASVHMMPRKAMRSTIY